MSNPEITYASNFQLYAAAVGIRDALVDPSSDIDQRVADKVLDEIGFEVRLRAFGLYPWPIVYLVGAP